MPPPPEPPAPTSANTVVAQERRESSDSSGEGIQVASTDRSSPPSGGGDRGGGALYHQVPQSPEASAEEEEGNPASPPPLPAAEKGAGGGTEVQEQLVSRKKNKSKVGGRLRSRSSSVVAPEEAECDGGDEAKMPWKVKPSKMGKKVVNMFFRVPGKNKKMSSVDGVMMTNSGLGEPSIYHALVVIFLEFFAWGLLTSPMITVLNQTFPDHTFLMNGLIQGIKGILSFLSAPLIGALSDIWGRKFFLLLTVFFTCIPIPLMRLNTWWYFAMISISGVFAVTFSVVFAYVADVTDETDRSAAYGLVSATFAASLVTSPALGAYLEQVYSEEVVIMVATAIASLDVFFILVAVPESLPDKCRPQSRGLTLEQVDPFAAMRKAWKDKTILMLCVTVFLSYLPEAGQYSCFFVYLRLVMGFSKEAVAMFIAAVGILSVIAQTGLLTLLMKTVGSKHTIMVGLLFEMLQLMWYGFGSQSWMMWAAGVLAAVSSITYPAISAFVSMHADADQQGLVQGMITGMRGLCNGLGPAMFGLIFNLFNVDLLEQDTVYSPDRPQEGGGGGLVPAPAPAANFTVSGSGSSSIGDGGFGLLAEEDAGLVTQIVPGPPFVFGALLVILALMVSAFIPESFQVARQSGSQGGGDGGSHMGGSHGGSLASADGIGLAPSSRSGSVGSRRGLSSSSTQQQHHQMAAYYASGGEHHRRGKLRAGGAVRSGSVGPASSLAGGGGGGGGSSSVVIEHKYHHHHHHRGGKRSDFEDDDSSSDREYTVPLIHTAASAGGLDALNSSGDSSAL